MDSIKIKKAKLTREMTLELTYSKESAKSVEEHYEIVHADLANAFKKLTAHFGLMCYFITTKQVKDINNVDEKLLQDLHVGSYAVSGSDDDPGITLSGTRILPDGKALNLNTPFHRYDEGEGNGYRYMEDLKADIETIEGEINLYLFGNEEFPQGKHAPNPQGDLFADAGAMERVSEIDEEEEIDLDIEVKPAKKSAKKIKK